MVGVMGRTTTLTVAMMGMTAVSDMKTYNVGFASQAQIVCVSLTQLIIVVSQFGTSSSAQPNLSKRSLCGRSAMSGKELLTMGSHNSHVCS